MCIGRILAGDKVSRECETAFSRDSDGITDLYHSTQFQAGLAVDIMDPFVGSALKYRTLIHRVAGRSEVLIESEGDKKGGEAHQQKEQSFLH